MAPGVNGPSLPAVLVQVLELEIVVKPGFTFADFLSCPTSVRDWNIQGLPSDAFSTENGVIVTRGNRWVLVPVLRCCVQAQCVTLWLPPGVR